MILKTKNRLLNNVSRKNNTPMKPLFISVASITLGLCGILFLRSGFTFQVIILLLLLPLLFLVDSKTTSENFLFDGLMKKNSFDEDYKVLKLLGQ